MEGSGVGGQMSNGRRESMVKIAPIRPMRISVPEIPIRQIDHNGTHLSSNPLHTPPSQSLHPSSSSSSERTMSTSSLPSILNKNNGNTLGQQQQPQNNNNPTKSLPIIRNSSRLSESKNRWTQTLLSRKKKEEERERRSRPSSSNHGREEDVYSEDDYDYDYEDDDDDVNEEDKMVSIGNGGNSSNNTNKIPSKPKMVQSPSPVYASSSSSSAEEEETEEEDTREEEEDNIHDSNIRSKESSSLTLSDGKKSRTTKEGDEFIRSLASRLDHIESILQIHSDGGNGEEDGLDIISQILLFIDESKIASYWFWGMVLENRDGWLGVYKQPNKKPCHQVLQGQWLRLNYPCITTKDENGELFTWYRTQSIDKKNGKIDSYWVKAYDCDRNIHLLGEYRFRPDIDPKRHTSQFGYVTTTDPSVITTTTTSTKKVVTIDPSVTTSSISNGNGNNPTTNSNSESTT